MTVQMRTEIMPHVRFEIKDYGRNEQASKEAGRHIPLRANFIFITSHGSKDCPEFPADEWFARKQDEASRGNYNGEWLAHFQKQYDAWQKGHELPRQGTPILTWPTISPEQNVRLRSLGYQVVEDIAAIPDGSLGQLGLDGRVLRDMARAYIAEGKEKGINTQKIAELSAQLESRDATIAQMQATLAELKAQIGEKRGPGRPRKIEEDEAA